ncbi:hypothetical protein LINPERHAP1_LOCUS21332 [Linum perenne]
MELAWNCGIRKLKVQSDSAIAVKLLSTTQHDAHQHFNLIRRFQELKSRQWDVTIEHIYREANFAADFLANSGHEYVLSLPCNGCGTICWVFVYPVKLIIFCKA